MRSIIFILLVTTLFFNCGSSKRNKVVTKKSRTTKSINSSIEINPKAYNVIDNAMEYNGVRYKYGGSSKKGIDCSGLVMTAYQKEDIILPRTTRDLAKTGNWIDLKQVLPGDLMFFATNKNSRTVNHVGIVTKTKPGIIEFIHSTTSQGVITSTLDEKYWYFAFVQARRVL